MAKEHHDHILDVVLDSQQITWQSIIYDLIRSEEMDPWDINVSLLTKRYITLIKELKEHDFRVSGKVVLAASMLLKIKSQRWIEEDIAGLDALFTQADEQEDYLEFDEDLEYVPREQVDAALIPRTPQPRKRKVSVYDLVDALEKALEVKHRRVIRKMPDMVVEPPKKKRDISEVIKDMYGTIMSFFKQSKDTRLTFSKLASDQDKEGRVYTFIPLLHLTNQGSIDINQYEHFGEIEIELKKT